MKVSIIILIYNAKKFIESLFDSIFNQTYKNFEVIAVINGSNDGSKELITQKYPSVKIIDPHENLWFSKGNNVGIRESTGDLVYCVNQDVILEPDNLAKMVEVFQNEKVGAATGKVLRYDFINNKKLNIIDTTGIIMSKSGRGKDRGQLEVDLGQYDQNRAVFGVSGAVAMYRRSALEKVKYCSTVIASEAKQSNYIIIHGCPSKEEDLIDITRMNAKHWIPWVAENLRRKNLDVYTPLMPKPWAPDYDMFKKEIERYPVSESTILVGHSCGCAFLVRWLGESKKKIKKLILVAPWKIPSKYDLARDRFYTFPIDETIKSRVKEIIMFTSDNEREDGKKSLEIYRQSLNGKVISLKERGHFTFDDMHTTEFPELLEEVLKLGDTQTCEYFDEDFVAYWEDVDMSWRLNNAGFKNVYVPEAISYHGRTAGSAKGGYLKLFNFIKHHKTISPEVRRLNYKNHILMYIKNARFIHPLFIFRELAMFCYILIFEATTLSIMPKLFSQLRQTLKKREAQYHLDRRERSL